MPNKSTSSGNQMADTVETFGQNLADRARQATESMSDAARSAADQLGAGRMTTADGLDDAASAVRDKADDLPGGEQVRNFARGAADRLHTTADYVRTHDFNRMMAEVETVVKNNPGVALLGAAAFGFLVGRALTRE